MSLENYYSYSDLYTYIETFFEEGKQKKKYLSILSKTDKLKLHNIESMKVDGLRFLNIPLYREGQLIGKLYRHFHLQSLPQGEKYKWDAPGIEIRKLIYCLNGKMPSYNNHLIVYEGILDYLQFANHENEVSLLGTPHKEKLDILSKYNKLDFIFDNDAAGWEFASQVKKYFTSNNLESKVRVVKFI